MPRLPDIKRSLHLSDSGLGLALTGAVIGSLAVSPLFSKVVDRFGSRVTTRYSSLMIACVLPVVAFAPTSLAFFLALMCLGVGDAFADVAVNTQAMELQVQRSRSIMTRLHGAWSIGTLTSGLVAGRCAATGVSVRTQLLVTMGALISVALVAVRWLLADTKVTPTGAVAVAGTGAGTGAVAVAGTGAGAGAGAGAGVATAAGSTSASPAATAPHETPPLDWRGPSRASVALVVLAGAGAVLAELPATEWATLIMIERFAMTPGRATLGFAGFAIGMVVGRMVGDNAADRLGVTKGRRLGAALNAVGFLIACLVPNAGVVVAALTLAGVGSSWINPLLVRRAAEVFKGPRGPALAGVGARAGILLGSPLMGRLSDARSRSFALLVIGGGAALLLTVLRLPGDES